MLTKKEKEKRRTKIIDLFKQGWSQDKIVKELRISKTDVNNVLHKYRRNSTNDVIQEMVSVADKKQEILGYSVTSEIKNIAINGIKAYLNEFLAKSKEVEEVYKFDKEGKKVPYLETVRTLKPRDLLDVLQLVIAIEEKDYLFYPKKEVDVSLKDAEIQTLAEELARRSLLRKLN